MVYILFILSMVAINTLCVSLIMNELNKSTKVDKDKWEDDDV